MLNVAVALALTAPAQTPGQTDTRSPGAVEPTGAGEPAPSPETGPADATADTESQPKTRPPPPTPRPAPPPAKPQTLPQSPEKTEKKKKKKKISFSVGGRVMAGWEYSDKRPAASQEQTPSSEQKPFLRQARAKLRVNYKKIFKVRLSAELADALKTPDVNRVRYLRNAYGLVRFHDAIRLQFGYFKRPFSRLELRSPRRLPIRGRGLANSLIVEDRNYGDRSVGSMLWGKIKPARLRWFAGAFAPALRTKGIDAVGRLQVDPTSWLSLGGGGIFKRVINGTGQTVHVGGVNTDARLKIKGLYLLGDVIVGQDYLVPGEPWSFGGVGYASYDIDLPKKFTLQPVVSVEWADADLAVSQNDAIRSIAGLNLLWRKRFRIMPQARFVRPLGTIGNPWIESDTYYVMLSLEI